VITDPKTKQMKIDRRNFIRKAGIGTISFSFLGKEETGTNVYTYKDVPEGRRKDARIPPPDRPNIIYIHSHDTGRYIQPFGYAIPTPNLQKLAEEGVLFRKYFTTHPTSSASRASLLTGMYPHNNGMIGLAHRGFKLKDPGRHLNFTLKKYGYRTVLSGVQHVIDRKDDTSYREIGYDEFLGNPSEAHVKASEWLDNAPDSPFFLSVGFTETHREYPRYKYGLNPDHVVPPQPLPDVSTVREDFARFTESASILDDKIGMVLGALRRNGLEDNTLVICTTDHGIAFPTMKCNLYDGGTGIFLIMRGPGGFTGGKTIDSMISVIDIFPTICELLQIQKPDWLDGKSIMPIIKGERNEIRDELFLQVNYHASYEPVRGVRTDRYKYIKRYSAKLNPVLPNCDDGLSKQYWLDNGWKETIQPREELYDLIFDPNERNNLMNDPSKRDIVKEMTGRLDRLMKETGDPLIKGYITAPPDAILNPSDDLSPRGKTFPASELFEFNRGG
jgi:N-sulfoglucosamine sulfohydrolase